MSDTQDYIRVTVPAPGEQFMPRLLRTDLLSEVSFPVPGEQFIPRLLRSDIEVSARIWEPVSTVGAWDPVNPLPDTITIGLSHA